MKTKNATLGDLKNANSVVRKMKEHQPEVALRYPRLGRWKTLHIEAWADASFGTQPDEELVEGKVKSVRGSVIFLCNESRRSAIIYWKSKTISNVCKHVKAAETFAMSEGMEEAINIAQHFYEIYNGSPYTKDKNIGTLPIDFFTDSKTLKECISSSKHFVYSRSLVRLSDVAAKHLNFSTRTDEEPSHSDRGTDILITRPRMGMGDRVE